jgi:hypothetical protein
VAAVLGQEFGWLGIMVPVPLLTAFNPRLHATTVGLGLKAAAMTKLARILLLAVLQILYIHRANPASTQSLSGAAERSRAQNGIQQEQEPVRTFNVRSCTAFEMSVLLPTQHWRCLCFRGHLRVQAAVSAASKLQH